MLKVSWREETRNFEILSLLQEKPEIVATIDGNKSGYFGHVMRAEKY